jgi:pimeloyl-ACP methyl ester carboxylesterase
MSFERRPRSVAAFFPLLCLLAALLSMSACAWLDAKQRQIIYRPSPSLTADNSPLGAGDSRFFLQVPDTPGPQRIELWWLPNVDAAAPAALYLHGTLRHLQGNRHKIEALREAGFSVLAIDYRGWGQSTPITPSEQTIMQDAALAWAELRRRAPEPVQRVIYGHSMGSGVAVNLASQLPPNDYGAVILESAFTSFADVAATAGFWADVLARFNNERFASVDKISQIHAPLLMLHGSLDNTIPIALGEKLFASANAPKQWLRIEGGGHSDLNLVAHDVYQATLAAFRVRYLSGHP